MRLSHKYYYSDMTRRQHLFTLLVGDFMSATVLYYSNCESLALDLLIGPLARHLHLYSAHKHCSRTVIPHRRWAVLRAAGLYMFTFKMMSQSSEKHTHAHTLCPSPAVRVWCVAPGCVFWKRVCVSFHGILHVGDGLQKPSRCGVCQLWDHFSICASGKNKQEKVQENRLERIRGLYGWCTFFGGWEDKRTEPTAPGK